ncbi:MAG: serine/threonine-protein kinase [Actinomycetota bacterium]
MADFPFDGDWGGKWVLTDELIGESQFKVFKGRSESGDPVAVKRVPLGAGVDSRRLRRREKDIAEKLRDVDAKHLIRVLDVSETDTEILLVMDLAKSQLTDLLPQGSINPQQALEILIQLTTGLRELHQASVIHRDLKPDNVLRHEGHWKLSDFGIARDAELGTQDPTFVGWGTDPYCAPETWRGESPTFRTDLYSLGCMGIELVTGSKPFPGPDRDEYRRQHLEVTPDPITEVPPILARLLLRLLAKSPGGRPEDARAVEEQLRQILAADDSSDGGQLARLALAHEGEVAVEAAADSVERAAMDEKNRAREQGSADLQEILNQAGEAIAQAISNVDYGWEASVIEIRGAFAEVTIIVKTVSGLMPDDTDDGALAWGEVTLKGRHYPERIAANIVLEDVDGRIAWVLYRFVPNKTVHNYPFGSRDNLHGLQEHDFRKHRQFMRDNVTHVFDTRRILLTPQLLKELYAEALQI